MIKRIAINGFGRIGRTIFRIINERMDKNKSNLAICAINDLTDMETMAYLLKYDSIYGKFENEISVSGNTLIVNKNPILIYREKDPSRLPWKKHNIDIAIESTGMFASETGGMMHISAGAEKVLISAPIAEGPLSATVCYGVNNEQLKLKTKIISTASCTTNCIAPIAKILNDEFGINKSFVTTIHSYTNDQRILDLGHSDKRRSRAAALSMIPTTTGAAKVIAAVIPSLRGKFDGLAIRVPTPNVSCIDMVSVVNKNTNKEAINQCLKEAAFGPLKGILGFTMEPLVSVDFNKTNESSIVDGSLTKVLDENFVKIISWYDNEWGFGNRAVDLLEKM